MGLFSKLFTKKENIANSNTKTTKKEIERELQPTPKYTFTTTELQPKIIYEKIPFSLIECPELKESASFFNNMDNDKYEFIIGINEENAIITQDISQMPNLLIGGTIMTGKTTFIKSIICNLIMYKSPQDMRLIIFDSKGVDYSNFNGIPHLLTPVITNPQKAYLILEKIDNEIQRRYNLLIKKDARNYDEYNQKVPQKLHNILLVIDEYMTFNSNREMDHLLEKITLEGWKVGVNVILTVNHPSSEVITTLAKSNFLTRISFKTTSMGDSRIILGTNGAEKLCGKGEMLFLSKDTNTPVKVKGIFFPEDKVDILINYIIHQYLVVNKQKILFDGKFMNLGITNEMQEDSEIEYDDPMYDEVVDYVLETQKVSASLLQRRFKFGYNRAARLVDILEERGIIGPQKGSKPREVLIRKD